MTQDETIEFERLKTARDSLLLKVANLRGRLETIAAEEREACAKVCEEQMKGKSIWIEGARACSLAIRARGQA
jgi:hypothetical protein